MFYYFKIIKLFFSQHTPEWFESDDCTATRCTLRQGQTFTGRALVILPRIFQTLDLALRASVLGVNVNLSIAPGYDSACHNLEGGFTCPTPANTEIVWGLRFPIQEPFNLNNLVIEGMLNIKLLQLFRF